MAKQKSKTFEVYGEFLYYRGFPQNKDNKGPEGADYSEHGGMCVTDLIMDEENMKKFKASGSGWKVYDRHYTNQKGEKPYKDILDDDQYLVKFRRKFEHHIADFAGPPVTELATGEVIDPEDGWGVGNGSRGYVQFTVFPARKGMGSRWEGAQITKWIKFPLSQGAGAHFEKRELEGVEEWEGEEEEDEQPRKTTKQTTKKAAPKKQVEYDDDDDLDDEIPF